jgi:hypothetical protein
VRQALSPALFANLPEPKIDPLLRNKERIVEPHDYGIHNGIVKLFTYQVGGAGSRKLPNWRWIETDLASDVHLLKPDLSGRSPGQIGQTSQMGQAVHPRKKPAQEDPYPKQ